MALRFVVGSVARLRATFTDPENRDAQGNATLVDPVSVTFKGHPPDGSSTVVVSGVRDSLGRFHGDLPLPVAGTWWVRVESTGFVAVSESSFEVLASHVP